MDASRWQTIRTLFAELVELGLTLRAARLEVIGESDPELRDSVERLLHGDANADARLASIERVLGPEADDSMLSTTPVDPLGLSGRMVAHFRVSAPIAVGGMGVIYRAEDTRLGRVVALKLPLMERFSRDARERFLREGRAAGSLDHPNVCAIHEVGESDDGYLYLAMTLYAGETLAARLERDGARDVEETLEIARALTRGLGAAHSAGIVHRDVKPSNVMLLPDGGVRLLDFGLAKPRDMSITGSGAMLGTVSYMSPEQIRGAAADARSDLWALGVVLYEMLTGKRPFDGDRGISIAYAILHDEPLPVRMLRPDIPPSLDAIVHALLQKDVEHRPASTASVELDLATVDIAARSDAAAGLEQAKPVENASEPRMMAGQRRPHRDDRGSVAIELRVMGSPDLLDDHGKRLHTVLVQPKRLGLLVFLALSRPASFHQRDELRAMFWPEQPEERARKSLNQALTFLRRSLGAAALPSRGADAVGVDMTLVRCDAVDFLDAANRGDEETALARYADVLPAFHVDDAPAFGEWLDQERRILRDRAAAYAAVLAERAEQRGDPTRAIDWTLRCITHAPYDEAAARRLALLYQRSGNPGRAVQVCDEYAARIRRDLDLEPSSEFTTLVQEIRSPPAPAVPAAHIPATMSSARQQDVAAAVRVNPPEARRVERGRRWKATIALIAASVALVAGSVALWRRHASRREFVVVADFSTEPSDSIIADVLSENTRRALSASQFLGPVPESQVTSARSRLHVPTSARLTVATARQVALGEGIRAVVAGSLARFGAGYALSLELISASSAEGLVVASRTGVGEAQLIPVLDTLSQELRARAGDDLQIIHAQPSAVALTSTSLQAMEYYVAAGRLPRDSAVTLLRAAVNLDTAFAAAYWQLSRRSMHSSSDERRAYRERAYSHRHGLTEYERLRIEAELTSDREERVERLREILAKYPNAQDASLLGTFYWERRDLASAENAFRRAIALDPNRLEPYIRLIDILVTRGHVAAARRAVNAVLQRFPGAGAAVYEATVAYAEGRRDRMRAILEARARLAADEGIDLNLNLAWLDLLEGRLAEWNRRSLSSIAPDSMRAQLLVLNADYWLHGRPAECLSTLDSLLEAEPTQRRNPDAAALYAQFNRPKQARSILAAYDSATARQDGRRSGQDMGRSMAMGWIFVAEGRPRDAIGEFRRAQMLPDGPASAASIAADPQIGLAFEHAGLADSAITSYEHFLNTPYSDRFWNDADQLAWVLEHVAALYEANKRPRDARSAYARLANLWNGADPELQPRVTHAKQRVAALAPWWSFPSATRR